MTEIEIKETYKKYQVNKTMKSKWQCLSCNWQAEITLKENEVLLDFMERIGKIHDKNNKRNKVICYIGNFNHLGLTIDRNLRLVE